MNVLEDDRYNPVQPGTPFSMALVCRRCGALVAWTGVEDGGARAVHNLFHDRLDHSSAKRREESGVIVIAAELPARLVDEDAGTEFATIEGAARDELMRLWDDLGHARHRAARGCWSGECENLTRRIVVLTRHVGATGWTQIQPPLIRSGLYERIHREAGLEHPPIDWERFEAYERRVEAGT